MKSLMSDRENESWKAIEQVFDLWEFAHLHAMASSRNAWLSVTDLQAAVKRGF